MQAYLRVTAGPDAGRNFDLGEGLTLTIGRGEKSDTKLTDGSVSRLHCTVKWEDHNFLLTDLESVGGTFVDGKKVKEHLLKHDQEFQIGATMLKLHRTGIADAATLMAAQKPAREISPDDGGTLLGQVRFWQNGV
jgi:pSer/pThr/pTyr-binding forkhead associated (FHA) protein